MDRSSIAAPSRPLPLPIALACAATAVAAYGVAFATRTGAAAVLIALPSLFLLARLGSARRVFYAGLIVGVAMYAPHLAFFYNVFGRPGVLLWLIAGLPIALFLLLLHHANQRLGAVWVMILTPVLWTGIEFFRSELYQLRFAWLLAGEAGVFLPGARLLRIGVYGLGFAFALAATLIIAPRVSFRLTGLMLSLVLAALIYLPPSTPTRTDSALHVAGIQLEYPTESTAAVQLDRLALAHPEAEILVLSEYSFGGPVPPSICNVVRRRHRYLIAGGKRFIDDQHFADTAFVIGPDGEEVFRQGKSVPVQFMSDGLPAADRHVWNSPWGKIGIAVCYDISYARVMDDFVRQGAQGLILPTMDLESWGRYERRMLHGRMAPTRSAEYGIPTFSVWSSGESQLVDRHGRIIATAGYPGQGEMIAGPFDMSRPGHIPWDRWLAMSATIATGFCATYLLIAGLIRRKPSNAAPQQ